MRVKPPSRSSEIRPLTSRALTSVLDTLRPRLYGASILDLFSGAGRFGLGCLKEGAESVTFVELSRANADALKKWVGAYPANGAVIAEDVFKYLPRAAEQKTQFEIVFADPPFPLWNETFTHELFAQVCSILDDNAIFLVKHPKRMLGFRPVRGLLPWKNTQFGDSGLTYFKYETEGNSKKADG